MVYIVHGYVRIHVIKCVRVHVDFCRVMCMLLWMDFFMWREENVFKASLSSHQIITARCRQNFGGSL